MQIFFGVEVDTTSMTLEELEEARKNVRDMLSNLEFQILMRKKAERKHSNSSD